MDKMFFLLATVMAVCSFLAISHTAIGLGVAFGLISIGFFILSGADMISQAIRENKF